MEETPSLIKKKKIKKAIAPEQQVRLDLTDFSTVKGDEDGQFIIANTWTEHATHPKLEFEEKMQIMHKI